MNALTLTELLRMTRTELLGPLAANAAELAASPNGLAERHNADANLRKIRWALARGEFAP